MDVITKTQVHTSRNVHSISFVDDSILFDDLESPTSDGRRFISHSNFYMEDNYAHPYDRLKKAWTQYNERNTWDDWFLVPTERPSVNNPDYKSNYIDVPGANSSIDFTESLTNYPLYSNRTGSWTFRTIPGYYPWDVLYQRVSNFLHGRKLRVILEDDAYYYYVGRLKVNEFKSSEHNSEITIDYDLEPYKYVIWDTQGDWLWDNMDFEYERIYDVDDYTWSIEGTETISLAEPNIQFKDPTWTYKEDKYYGMDSTDMIGRMPVYPVVTVESTDQQGMTVLLQTNDLGQDFTNVKTYTFPDGVTNRSFMLTNVRRDSHTKLTVTGNGIFKLGFRRGELG